ncbi:MULTISPECIES: hypothetical protein [unclassified Amycolatopsis]|uniref:hypothetical protein n=1 Tax=unclassified Amycolatopsis TaxID=2618356 RepID=UPI001FF447B1|nr:hypothetical protein [Amycolatopsis sp. FBCC-B4732]UOX87705.1 hypothetical protein MUY14_39300 [Amycolatopsis sp. FBCC-B4732]
MDEREAVHNEASGVSTGSFGQIGAVHGNVIFTGGPPPEPPPRPAAASGPGPAEAARTAVRLMAELGKQPLARIRKNGYAGIYRELAKLAPPDAAAVLRYLPLEEISGLLHEMPVPLAARVLPQLGLDHLRELAARQPQAFADGRLLCYSPAEDVVELLRELPSSTAMDLLGQLRRGSTGSTDGEHHARQAAAARIWEGLARR